MTMLKDIPPAGLRDIPKALDIPPTGSRRLAAELDIPTATEAPVRDVPPDI